MTSFTNLIQAFGRARVLVVGDAILDEYLTGECLRVSPEAPVPVVQITGTRTVLGGAANTAANVSSLGGKSILVALAGRDEGGRRLDELARVADIDYRPVL